MIVNDPSMTHQTVLFINLKIMKEKSGKRNPGGEIMDQVFWEAFWKHLGNFGPPSGRLFRHPGTILAALWLPFRVLWELLGQGKAIQNSTDKPQSQRRRNTAENPPRTVRESAENPPRTRRANTVPIFRPHYGFCKRDLAYDKRLEQKWGDGAPPWGDFN